MGFDNTGSKAIRPRDAHGLMPEELPLSLETQQILHEAQDIALQAGQSPDTSHLILASFTLPCVAQSIMLERRISWDKMLELLRDIPSEPPHLFAAVWSLSGQIAYNVASPQITSSHLLLAISRLPSSRAALALKTMGLPMSTLRSLAMAHLTDPRLRRAATQRLARNMAYPEEPPRAIPTSRIWQQVSHPPRTLTEEFPRQEADEEECVVDFVEPESIPTPCVSSEDKRYTLDPTRYPTLIALGRNLSEEAAQGRLDPLIGRQDILEEVIDILSKRRSNNPILLGDPGVGKTAIVEGLACHLVNNQEMLGDLAHLIIVSLSVADLLAGTAMRGSFAARLKALKDEVIQANRSVILFIDEIHTIIGAGVGDGGMDAANDLKGALARGQFPCIGATTFSEYKRSILGDPALARRFESVFVREPALQEAQHIIDGVAPVYEKHHGVCMTQDARKAAVRLTDRVIVDRALPAKAIDVLDRAGARVRREGRNQVTRKDVVTVLSGLLDLPEYFLSLSPSKLLHRTMEFMKDRVFGHDTQITEMVQSISQNWLRFGSRKPLGSFLLAGPMGTGKRTTCLALAEFLFGSSQAVLEIDLSDFMEPHSLSHLVGSPPGYVGHEEGGLLADALMRRPFLLVLWQNVELAHPTIQNLIIQIISGGTTTDRQGRTIDFRNSIHCLTTAVKDPAAIRTVGFAPMRPNSSSPQDPWVEQCKKTLPMELFVSLDRALGFSPLDESASLLLLNHILQEARQRFTEEHCVQLVFSDAMLPWIFSQHKNASNTQSLVAERIITPATQLLFGHEGPLPQKIMVAPPQKTEDSPFPTLSKVL